MNCEKLPEKMMIKIFMFEIYNEMDNTFLYFIILSQVT